MRDGDLKSSDNQSWTWGMALGLLGALVYFGVLLAFSRQQTLRPEVLQLPDIVSEVSQMLKRLLGWRRVATLFKRDAGDASAFDALAHAHSEGGDPIKARNAGLISGGVNAAMGDGSVRFVQQAVSEKVLAAAVTARGPAARKSGTSNPPERRATDGMPSSRSSPWIISASA